MLDPTHALARARDALEFDPLPESRWVAVADDGIRVTVPYSEALSRLLNALPGAEWLALERCWRLPFTARAVVVAVLPSIERLAPLANDAPEEEERQRRLAAAVAAARADAHAAKTAQDRLRYGGRPRPFRHEFLVPKTGSSRVSFELEAIQDRSWAAPYTGGERPWVAQLFGSDGRGGFTRSFLKGNSDYSRSNSRGSRGVYRCYVLEEGPIYEVNDRLGWQKTERYFVRVQGGNVVRIDAEDVWACIEN